MALNIYAAFSASKPALKSKPSIEDEETDAEHPGWIALADYCVGVEKPTSSSQSVGSLAQAIATFEHCQIKKWMSKSSPNLMLALAKSTLIKFVTIHVSRMIEGKNVVIMEYRFTDCILGSYNTIGSRETDGTPLEDISFSYSGIEWDYNAYDKNNKSLGKTSMSWDVRKNEGK